MTEQEIEKLKVALGVLSGRLYYRDYDKEFCQSNMMPEELKLLESPTPVSPSRIKQAAEDIVFDYLTKKEAPSA